MAHLVQLRESRTALWLLAMMGFYLAAPFVELPLAGLSLSAPLFALLAVDWAVSPEGRPLRSCWVVLTTIWWAGCAASLAVALWTGQLGEVDFNSALLLLRSGYWCLVLIVVASVTANLENPRKVAAPLAYGLSASAMLRLVEASALGTAAGARWLSANDYGMVFSTFTPFLLWQAVSESGARRWFAIALLPVVFLVIAFNGSRSSWAGVLLGVLAFAALTLISCRRSFRLLWLVAGEVLALVLLVAVPGLRTGAADRWSTLSRLETDKPFQTRAALVEKGLLLFESRPWFGVGLGRFTAERAILEPSRAPWTSVDELNRRSPHNAYIKVLAETGAAGTLPLLALLSVLFLSGVPASIALARSGETWGIAVMASMAGMCLHLGTLSGLTNTAPWFIFGLAAAVCERKHRRI